MSSRPYLGIVLSMAASKSVIVLFALVAAAAAVGAPVKRQIYAAVAPLPYARAVLPAVHHYADDGSWAPGKYDPLEVVAPISPLAPLVRAGLPLAHAGLPYAAPLAHWGHPLADDGSYWAGKYGPEWQ